MAELDAAYANADFIPDGASFPARWQAEAAAYRAARRADGRATLGVSYGPTARQAYDVFTPVGASQGLMIFVHGGFWRMTDRSVWSHLAKGARARGWTTVLPSYDLCPDVRIADITLQIAQAVTQAARSIDGPIVLTGHSAGGHLVARMCAPGMLAEDVAPRVRHVMPISPLSDLRPLLRTAMNDDFQMDEAAAFAESPVVQPAPDMPVTVWVGGAERPAFLHQARWLAEAWACAHVIAPDAHHFDVIEPLTDPNSEMIARLLNV